MQHRIFLLTLCFFLTACSPSALATPEASPTPAVLIPWASPTPAPTVETAATEPAEPLPQPSPTPRTHIIESGEDLGGLALRYNVPLSDLLAANPDLNPRAISIGTAIIIPAAGEGDAPAQPPVDIGGLTVQPARCQLDAAGDLTCFSAVLNGQESAVENISLNFILVDAGGGEIASQLSYAPLNLLPGSSTMPFLARFQGPPPAGFSARAELAGALPGASTSGRYLEHSLEDAAADIAPDGLSARAHGRIQLAGDQPDTAVAWVLAVGYNAAGDVIGFRRWEDSAGIEAGQSRDFDFMLYSSQERIEKVEFLSEVRP